MLVLETLFFNCLWLSFTCTNDCSFHWYTLRFNHCVCYTRSSLGTYMKREFCTISTFVTKKDTSTLVCCSPVMQKSLSVCILCLTWLLPLPPCLSYRPTQDPFWWQWTPIICFPSTMLLISGSIETRRLERNPHMCLPLQTMPTTSWRGGRETNVSSSGNVKFPFCCQLA